MDVEVRQDGDVILVDMKGRLVAGTGAEQLQEIINELLAADWRKIVLNLSGIDRIDSAGIGELVSGIRLAERFSSKINLLHVKGQVRDILALSQLLPLLDIYYTEEEALAGFDGIEGPPGDSASGEDAEGGN